MFENLPVPYICGIFDSQIKMPQKTVTDNRTVKNYEIEYLLSGGGTNIVNGVEFPVKYGNILLAKPGDVRKSVLPFSCKFVHFGFADKALAEKIASFPSVIHPENSEKFKKTLDEVCDAFLKSKSPDDTSVSAGILSLIGFFENEVRTGEKTEKLSDAVKRAKAYIDENFSENISLMSLAEKVHLSPIYFHGLFKKEIGVTPMKYLFDRRISSGALLLKTTNLSISEISQSCGFSSQSYFGFCFKNEMEMTPAEYRKSVKYPDISQNS